MEFLLVALWVGALYCLAHWLDARDALRFIEEQRRKNSE